MWSRDCNGCGLSVHDLPLMGQDPEDVRDMFFEFDDSGDLYCQACINGGAGVFL